jgi:membrane protein
MFKVLPDAKIRWKDSMAGASFTAILFIIGKFLIGFYIGNSKTWRYLWNSGLYCGDIVMGLLYTSIILYFGAEYTKIHSCEVGAGIEPDAQAVYIIKTESKELNPHPAKGGLIMKAKKE